MNVFDCFVGIDSSKSDFAAAIYRDPKQKVTFRDKMANNVEGFQEFLCWMQSHQLNTDQTLICVEATGVYSEAICYYLHQHNFQVWLEAPQKVKHAFKVSGHKTDPVDAGLIAEYAFRYTDRYRRWQPKHDILEQLGTLLATRELITQNRTALSNAFSAFNRKCCKTPLALKLLNQNMTTFAQQIKQIDKQMMELVKQHSQFHQFVILVDSTPGIAELGAINLLVVTNGGSRLTQYENLAAFIGICPYQHTSGSSVRKKPTSSRLGPPRLRKLLHLAAKSLAHNSNNKHFKAYYLKKLQQGKPPKLIYNNIANKILRIACAVLRERKPYEANYIAINTNI